MALPSVTISLNVTNFDDSEPQNIVLSARSSDWDVDGSGTVVPLAAATANGDASGVATLAWYPNGAGTRGVTSNFEIKDDAGDIIATFKNVHIPIFTGTLPLTTLVQLNDLSVRATGAASTLVIMTTADYNALVISDPALAATLTVATWG